MSGSIDAEVIESLKELGGEDDPGLFQELVDVFLTDTPPRLEAMTEAVANGDAEALMTAAHSLKSSAANMGALHLSALCRQLEAQGREGNHAMGDDVAAAKQEFETVARLLREACR